MLVYNYNSVEFMEFMGIIYRIFGYNLWNLWVNVFVHKIIFKKVPHKMFRGCLHCDMDRVALINQKHSLTRAPLTMRM